MGVVGNESVLEPYGKAVINHKIKECEKMENSITITRKYTLYPELSERKEWTKKVTEFIVNSYNQKIEYYNAKLDKAKTKK